MEISAHGTIRHRAYSSGICVRICSAGLLRQTLVDLAKALSLRSQGNFANFICRVHIAISLAKMLRYISTRDEVSIEVYLSSGKFEIFLSFHDVLYFFFCHLDSTLKQRISLQRINHLERNILYKNV